MINIKKKHVLDIYKSMDLVFKTVPTIKYMDILTTSQLPPISYHPCFSEVWWGSCVCVAGDGDQDQTSISPLRSIKHAFYL